MNTAQRLLISIGFPQVLLSQHAVNTIQRYGKATKRKHPRPAIRAIQRKMEADYKKWKEQQ